ncbi:MAG TPA: hypothetical protein VG650_13320 [Mycobacteriales bacterium]|nr:hypothetical protein [Mycobacteriales bacterium]
MRDLERIRRTLGDPHLIGQARLLRRQGKTYNEIRIALREPIIDDRLQLWMRGIPRPPETNRSGLSKPELRRKVRQLRAEGLTIGEIAEITGAAQGSISLWMRDIRVPARVEQRRQAHLQELRGRGAKALHDAAIERSAARVMSAQAAVGVLSERELMLVGAALYWAEGTKEKPWRRNGRVILINSDASVLAVFLAWLDLMGVPERDRRYRLNIHETASVDVHERWWANELGLVDVTFQRATLKRHNPKTVRRNVGDGYHGCLVISVNKSRVLYDSIVGWWSGIARSV